MHPLGWTSSSLSCFSYLFSQAGGRAPQEQPPGLGLILCELLFSHILTGSRPDPTGTASWAGPHPLWVAFLTYSHRLEAGPHRNSLLGWASSSVSCFSYIFSQAGGRAPQEQPPGLGLILCELLFLHILTGWRPGLSGTSLKGSVSFSLSCFSYLFP